MNSHRRWLSSAEVGNTYIPVAASEITMAKTDEKTTPGFENDPVYIGTYHKRHYNFLPFAYDTCNSNKHLVNCEIKSTSCCGVRDLYGIDFGWSAKDMLYLVVETYSLSEAYGFKNGEYTCRWKQNLDQFDKCCHPFFLWTSGKGKVQAAVTLIEKLKLGKITVFGPKKNPTGSSKLEMAVWEPDKKALLDWYKAQVVKRDEEEKKGKGK